MGAYGVPSEPLGKLKNRREVLDPDDLATGAEVLSYYDRVMAKFVATGACASSQPPPTTRSPPPSLTPAAGGAPSPMTSWPLRNLAWWCQ